MRGARRYHLPIAAVALAVIVLGIYGQTWRHGFVDWDDDKYILENPHIRDGLGPEAVAWAFTTFHASNWHPLTWLSHMLDYRLFGLNAGGHHLVGALLHAASAVLLLLALHALTGSFWPSLLVAALFAVHPLRVESVAWASERKDVLSGLFWMLSLWAYARYAARPGAARYLAVTACVALGLLAKPMLVTLPLVLLLLDVWPLGRWNVTAAAPSQREGGASPARAPVSVSGLVLEKLPWLALAAASSAVTVAAQLRGGSVSSLEHVPWALRASNALTAYAGYLWKTVWPAKLAFLYPHPALVARGGVEIPVAATAGAALLLAAITGLALWRLRDRPYMFVGWAWFLGTLVPVIGLFQVGRQALADRYAYLPLIGVYIMLAWGLRDLVGGRRGAGRVAAALSAAAVAALSVVAWNQVGHWRDSRALFEHALRVTEDNYVAHAKLATLLRREGRLDPAERHYREVLKIRPDLGSAHAELALLHATRGDLDVAEALYTRALELDPSLAEAHTNLGNLYRRRGQTDRAEQCYRRALAADPEYPLAYVHLGNLLARRGELEPAAVQYRLALERAPDDVDANYNLAVVLAALGDAAGAERRYERTLAIAPEHAEARRRLEELRRAAGQMPRQPEQGGNPGVD